MSTGVNGGTLDEIVREWARAQIQRMDIVNYNGAQLSYNHQADMANRLGLSDKQKLGVTPFPCPTHQTLAMNSGSGIQESKTDEGQDTSQQTRQSTGDAVQPPVPSDNKTRSLLWPTIGAAALSALLTAGSIGGTAWVMQDDKPRETQVDPEGRVGVDVIGWPSNLTSPP